MQNRSSLSILSFVMFMAFTVLTGCELEDRTGSAPAKETSFFQKHFGASLTFRGTGKILSIERVSQRYYSFRYSIVEIAGGKRYSVALNPTDTRLVGEQVAFHCIHRHDNDAHYCVADDAKNY